MWSNNKLVQYVYAHVNTKQAYAIIEGMDGWKRIAPTSVDGVSNVLDVLAVAQANNKRVNVYINSSSNQIEAAYFG
ncbi:MAG TPA: hypothetical protein DDY14_11495 [Chromatiaceae bacterium]|nr:MAG: hypothetical protein N838_27800 [Thiohalocapsa sp. PB-PSB1]QQO55834.1 MAG: hypothetical protein N838_23300 [Thiohalocapsa sp. PB-PSB1]HBG95911.1 hypothetical protein [Chromatiaceae bacterium]HCS89175.1 hypothetical protein [Chromatiaceae bacterium]